jgi:hypothetical protein
LDEDQDDLDVMVDLSEFDMGDVILSLGEDDTYSGDFLIPGNLTPRIYNITVTVTDPRDGSDSVRIKLTITVSEEDTSDEFLSSQVVLGISIVGFLVLLVLVIAVVLRSRGPARPQAPPGYRPGTGPQQVPMRPYGQPPGAPYGPGPMR